MSRTFSSNPLRAATNVRVLKSRLSRSDNTFETANNLGTIRSSSEPLNLRFKGTLDPSDPVDIFKLKISPGVEFGSDKVKWNITGGKLKLDGYAQHPIFTNNEITFLASRTFRGSNSEVTPSGFFNDSENIATFYLKFTTPSTKTVSYTLKLTASPA